MNTASLVVSVSLSNDTLSTTIEDRREAALSVFAPLNESQRTGLVSDAWSIGLRALTNAYKQAEESRLVDIGATLKQDVDKQLADYIERQQAAFVQVLARYFDPESSQVVARLDAFLRDDGALSTTMGRFLAPEHGAMAQTLARTLGENSPLFKRLSPTDSEGVIFLLQAKLREALAENQTEVARALDPVAEDGAVARFLRALRQELEKADNDRSKQLVLATKALDANDESSLLSRLMRETQSARTTLLAAINPEVAGSPMATLKFTLTEILRTHAKSQQAVLTTVHENQVKLGQDIRESLVRLEERKRGLARSPEGGFNFQDAVLRFVQQAVQGAPVTVDNTSAVVGAGPSCKVGDQVLRFTAESAFAGAGLVIEAKRENGWSVSKALAELETARNNRAAGVGVFVLARQSAPAGFPVFARFGNDVLIVWDDEDDGSDAYLHAALLLGLALTSRQRKPQDAGDIKALADIEHRIQHELERLAKMRKLSESIRKDAEELSDEIRKGGGKLEVLLRNAKATLKALNVELEDAAEARTAPVLLPANSLEHARAALEAGDPTGELRHAG